MRHLHDTGRAGQLQFRLAYRRAAFYSGNPFPIRRSRCRRLSSGLLRLLSKTIEARQTPAHAVEEGGTMDPFRQFCLTRCTQIILSVTLAAFAFSPSGFAQEIQTGVTYVCNGARLVIDSCNIRDTSDTSKCMVGHPDTVLPNGLMKYTYETRGDLKKLLPTCKQPSAKEQADARAFQQKQQAIYNAAVPKSAPPSAPASGPAQGSGTPFAQPYTPRTPQQRAMARCVTSGRLLSVCGGNALEKDLFGMVTNMVGTLMPGSNAGADRAVSGPQMAGAFQGSGWRLEFSEDAVGLSCAGMRLDSHNYRIDFVNNHAILTIANSPKNVVLELAPDGDLVGSGPQVVTGVLNAGVANGIDSMGKPVTVYEYQPVTRTCEKPVLSSKGAGPGIVDTEENILKTAFGGDTGTPTPPGLRMTGIYAAPSGFSVEFYPESVILGCGPDAARAYPYTVIADGRQVAVEVKAPDHPLTLAIRANNTLDPGSGAYVVEGRRITGETDDGDFTFAPFNLSCQLGALSPSQTIPAAGGAPASMNGSASPFGAGLSTPQAPLGNATLSIVSGLPAQAGAANPLAAHAYILLRASYAETLSLGGINVPQGVSPYKYAGTACASHSPDCARISDAVKASAVSAVRADQNGNGTLPGVPPGTYYLMISTRLNNQVLLWGQAVELKAGANSITLSQSNATPLN
jgi:hypothetical protein